jgi:Zn finger protein HypA/HybF involved in hydrogenase expression
MVKKDIFEYLVENSKNGRHNIKRRLLREGLIENVCSECGLKDTWNGKPISLELDHINGVNNDNRLENLRMLCPNCHSQTETFKSRNIKPRPIKVKQCLDCNKVIYVTSIRCKKCTGKTKQSGSPTEEILMTDFNNLKSYVAVGRKYGVSGNTIKKWIGKFNTAS